MSNVKRTNLYEKHLEQGAKIVEFAGWEMPVQYTSIIEEHKAVRNNVGLFDVSHMGENFVSGPDCIEYLETLVPQNIRNIEILKAQYCQLINPNGGIIDDLIIYRLEEKKFLIIHNAARINNDITWMKENIKNYDVKIDNQSENYSMLALQGPKASELIEKLRLKKDEQPKFFSIKEAEIANIPLFIARTGYTGEDGFELITNNENVNILWDTLLKVGKEYNIQPIGLGARDTLRLEAGLMLYGNDLTEITTPIEANLKWSIPNKEIDYIGKAKIQEQIANGTDITLIGFEMLDRAIPRHEYEIWYNDKKIGTVTSGGLAPTLNKNVGIGYISTKEKLGLDSIIQIMVRNKLYNAKITKLPFIKKHYKK